jgi:hypothetical protein
MRALLDETSAIWNAAVLDVDQVVHRRVRCPLCMQKVFTKWPEGWDAHAAGPCAGLSDGTPEQRKAEFKGTLGHLFR